MVIIKKWTNMKKIIIPLLFLFFLSSSLSAQRFHGGIYGGINASQVAGDSFSGYTKAGIVGGGFVNYAFADIWALQMEIAFSQKGSRHNPTDKNPAQYLLRLNYIDVPFLCKVKVGRKIGFELGASVEYLMSHYEEANYSEDVTNRGFNNFSGNLVAGISFYFDDHFSANLRTVNGLTPLRDDPTQVYTKRLGSSGQYNDLLALTLFYQF